MNNSSYRKAAIGIAAHSLIMFYMTSTDVLNKLRSIKFDGDSLMLHPQYEVFRKEVTEILSSKKADQLGLVHRYFEKFVDE